MGFGALLSPLIADPFLSDTNCILSNSTANASSNLPHIRKSLVPHHPGNLSHYDLPMKGMVVTRVSYAFWIMALINVSAAAGVAPAVVGYVSASRLCKLLCLTVLDVSSGGRRREDQQGFLFCQVPGFQQAPGIGGQDSKAEPMVTAPSDVMGSRYHPLGFV